LSRIEETLYDEVVIVGEEGDIWVWYNTIGPGYSGEVSHYKGFTENHPLYVSIGNVNDDEYLEVIIVDQFNKLYIFQWSPAHFLQLIESLDFAGETYFPAPVGDLDGDGIDDIIISCDDIWDMGNLRRVFYDTDTDEFTSELIDLTRNPNYMMGPAIIGRFDFGTDNELFISYSWFDNMRLMNEGVYELIYLDESSGTYEHNNYEEENLFYSMQFTRFAGCYYLEIDSNEPRIFAGDQNDLFMFDNELEIKETSNFFIHNEYPVTGVNTAFLNNDSYILTGNKKEMVLAKVENDNFVVNDNYHFLTSNEYVEIPTEMDFNNDGFSDFVVLKNIEGSSIVNIYETQFSHTESNVNWSQYAYDKYNSNCYSNYINYNIETNTTWWKDVTISGDVKVAPDVVLTIKPGVKVRFEENASLYITGGLKIQGDNDEKIVFTSNSNSDELYHNGIEIKNPNENIYFSFCEIEEAETGILVADANINVNINNCIIRNNGDGLIIYNSNPEISNNLIIDNENIGISCFKGANADIDNNSLFNPEYEIFIDQSRPLLEEKYNDLWNDDYYTVVYKPGGGSAQPLNVDYNWWGTTDIQYIRDRLLNDSRLFELDFICPIQNNENYTPTRSSDSRLLFESGIVEKDNGNFLIAEGIFKDLILTYPSCSEISLAFSALISCYDSGELNFNLLQSYYLELLNSYNENPENKILKSLITFCKRKKGEYDPAIADYEAILLNDPTYEDSCYAVIDIGNTYLEAEGRASGRLDYLIPESWETHLVTTKSLLKSIISNDPFGNDTPLPQFSVLYSNYPNPFNPSTTFSFSIPNDKKVNLSIYNIKGQKVRSIANDEFDKGFHRLIWDGKNTFGKEVSSGVYMYKLDVGGKTKAVKKCLMLK